MRYAVCNTKIKTSGKKSQTKCHELFQIEIIDSLSRYSDKDLDKAINRCTQGNLLSASLTKNFNDYIDYNNKHNIPPVFFIHTKCVFFKPHNNILIKYFNN